jgi:UDP-GlcNAc:undecaprenyl-phosphate GlcNAc-1-phosphate transferase
VYLILTIGFLAFVLSLCLTPVVRDVFLRHNIVDRPDQFRKLHSKPIPRVGGIAIAIAYASSFVIALILPFSYTSTLYPALPHIWQLCLAASLIFATGLTDDLIGLNPKWKLAEQLLAACMAYMAGIQIHFFPDAWFEPFLSIPVTLIWIMGCTNAFNLIDGMDGLAAGVGLFATITVLISALMSQNLELALVTVPLAGALLGFLRYNFNPASVFLGDCGSLLIGFLLGCYGILWSQKSATILGMTAPLMAMSIPLFDVALSIVRRFLRHQPIFGADRGHIHHKLLDHGLTPRRAAVLMYLASGLAAAFSLVQSAVVNQFQGLIIVLFCGAAWIGIQHLGYAEFGVARQVFMKGKFRRVIDGYTRLQQLETSLARAEGLDEMWPVLAKGAEEFGFTAIRMDYMNEYRVSEISRAPEHRWFVRIELPLDQYVEFTRGFDLNSPGSNIVAEFVRLVETSLSARFHASAGSEARIPLLVRTSAAAVAETVGG